MVVINPISAPSMYSEKVLFWVEPAVSRIEEGIYSRRVASTPEFLHFKLLYNILGYLQEGYHMKEGYLQEGYHRSQSVNTIIILLVKMLICNLHCRNVED